MEAVMSLAARLTGPPFRGCCHQTRVHNLCWAGGVGSRALGCCGLPLSGAAGMRVSYWRASP
eukprot:5491507-Lingulodinium_polyedra.AAC.1